jgi:hypothetical protein
MAIFDAIKPIKPKEPEAGTKVTDEAKKDTQK